jgi:hypothetical protein
VADPTSLFRCAACRTQVELPERSEPDQVVGCSKCRAPLGLFVDLDRRRRDRRFILTGGRPERLETDES